MQWLAILRSSASLSSGSTSLPKVKEIQSFVPQLQLCSAYCTPLSSTSSFVATTQMILLNVCPQVLCEMALLIIGWSINVWLIFINPSLNVVQPFPTGTWNYWFPKWKYTCTLPALQLFPWGCMATYPWHSFGGC